MAAQTPADYVIEKFKGVRPLARAIECSPSWVCRWRRARKDGGTGGAIPSEKQTAIIEAAERHGIKIDKSKLVLMP